MPATVGKLDAEVAVSGMTATSKDFLDTMKSHLPIVFLFVLSLAFILLLVTFRSIVIPIKAIILNLLSVGAAYGILTLVFQDGHGEKALDFTSVGGITPWLPLFLFVVLFGLSMDYHVFVLSRIRELVDRGMSTEKAVAEGIKSTAGVITSAAAVMVVTFGAFATGSDQGMKQLGIGLAAAILIDATIVRAVLLPATMKLLGSRNWYLPKGLGWLPKFEHEPEVVPAAGLIRPTSKLRTRRPPSGGRRCASRATCSGQRAGGQHVARRVLLRCAAAHPCAVETPRRRCGNGLLGWPAWARIQRMIAPESGPSAMIAARSMTESPEWLRRASRVTTARMASSGSGADGLGRRAHGARLEGHESRLVHRGVGGSRQRCGHGLGEVVSGVSGRRVIRRKPTTSASEPTGSYRPPQLEQSSPTISAGAPEL